MRKRDFLIALSLFLSQILIAQIERIEPPNWWIGMKDSAVQIMLYGQNISELVATTEYKDVVIERSSRVQSPNYLFVDLVIKPGCIAGSIPIKLLKGTREIYSFPFPLFKREEDSSKRKGFNTTDVIYLITPDRFANGTVENDNDPEMPDKANRSEPFGRHGGDIEGILEHLDYIDTMGFTSIWLNPVLENNMSRHSYHGYAITDFYNVDPRFGTNESYKKLCDEAQKKNIKVIMDMVVNHCGLSHWWMKDMPADDWINYHNQSYQQTNHRKTINSDPYAAKEDLDIMSKGWFVRTMPDLNLTNPYLGTYMIQNAIWWIEYAGLSGIRMDTYPYPDEGYMGEWSKKIMNEYPLFNIAGEIWYDDPGVLSYWQKGKKNSNGYTSHLPALFDFPLQSSLQKSLNASSKWEDAWIFLYETLAKDFQYYDPTQMVVFADNHDMSRIYTQMEEDDAKNKMALAYVLTVRGIPQIYYGTEILASNEGTDSHGVIRSDFPGGWKDDDINAFTGEGLSEKQKNTKRFLQQILNWRKHSEVIHHGKTKHFVPENNIYVFFRYHQAKTVMIILNKNEQAVTLNLDRFRNILLDATKGTSIINGNEILLGAELQLPEPGPVIIEIDY